MHDCQWSDLAIDDLDQIVAYIEQDNPETAFSIISKIMLETEQPLTRHPHLGRAGRVFNTRELVLRRLPYIVAYEVIGNRVQILGVMHRAQQWPDEFNPSRLEKSLSDTFYADAIVSTLNRLK